MVRGRLLLYVLAFPGLIALDIVTPLGIADWLCELVLVWFACSFGTRRESQLVFWVASTVTICGLWSSPVSIMPVWMGVLNRLVAIGVMWTMVNTAERHRVAEEAHCEAATELKMLQGLIPICSVCKSIKDSAGVWHKLETYLSANSGVRLTHGLCPPCAARYREELDLATSE
jgi:hypothetical protein